MKKITTGQKEILILIDQFISKYGFAPTNVEIADIKKYKSQNAAAEFIKRLEAKGYISKTATISRGLRVTEKGRLLIDTELGHVSIDANLLGEPQVSEKDLSFFKKYLSLPLDQKEIINGQLLNWS